MLCQFELFLYRPLGAKSLTAGSVDFLKESMVAWSALGSQRQNVLELHCSSRLSVGSGMSWKDLFKPAILNLGFSLLKTTGWVL